MEWVSTGLTVVETLALVAGVVLAVVSWRRQPRVALLAGLGLAALVLTNAGRLLEVLLFPHLGPQQANAVAAGMSLLAAVLRIAGLVLLTLALVARSRPRPAYVPGVRP